MLKKICDEKDEFSYLGFAITRYNTRYYSVMLDGTEVIGTPEELTDLIDAYLLKEI